MIYSDFFSCCQSRNSVPDLINQNNISLSNLLNPMFTVDRIELLIVNDGQSMATSGYRTYETKPPNLFCSRRLFCATLVRPHTIYKTLHIPFATSFFVGDTKHARSSGQMALVIWYAKCGTNCRKFGEKFKTT